MEAIDIAGCSYAGARKRNEDDWRGGGAGARAWAVLADGAGGHRDGREAARCVVEQVQAALAAEGAVFVPDTLSWAVSAAHAALCEAQPGARGVERMHATVVALWLDLEGARALWSHVGDSRLYRVRRGDAALLTRDDSVVQQLLDAGLLTERQALSHPHRNQLLAALGMPEAVQPHTLAEPEAVETGDVFLLCSDGWWGALELRDIAAALESAAGVQAWLAAMCARIEARAVTAQDNFSAVGVAFRR
ncbi:PP2C family protein-serine/threonine phosphatase [Azohydromonas aeria]|uniref:PP2C family protein-serine/threonine phosphatase n=1 Tax=Azohydromonas aeria TaxID=2590212 RepID=UPI0012F9CE85|nr:PP2C family serine/threonine-protein phosphatase [Azohydromonas aeria]